MTKGGIINEKNEKNFSVQYIKKKIKLSLKNLKTDYLDGYQLHNLESKDKIKTLLKVLKDYKKKGIIRSIGFSSRDPFDALRIIKKHNFDFFQVGFSIYDQRLVNSGLLSQVKKKKIFLLTRSPFNSGYLINKNNRKIFNVGFKKKINKFKKKNMKYLLYAGKNLEYSALKYCISFKNITSVIVGMTSKLQIDKNVRVVYHNNTKEKKWKKKLKNIYE